MNRVMWISYCQQLWTILEKQTESLEWDKSLRTAGFAGEHLEAASYALSALADQVMHQDGQLWMNSHQVGYCQSLHQEYAAGQNFFFRLEKSLQNKSTTWVWYFLAIRAGFRGQWIEDEDAFHHWYSSQNFPQLDLAPEELDLNFQSLHWHWSIWIVSALIWVFAITFYLAMAWK